MSKYAYLLFKWFLVSLSWLIKFLLALDYICDLLDFYYNFFFFYIFVIYI